MNEETRKLFSDLGSKNVKDLAFRDSWVFVGAKGVQNKSPFEQVRVQSPEQCAHPFCLRPASVPSVHAPEFSSSTSTPTQGSSRPLAVGMGKASNFDPSRVFKWQSFHNGKTHN